MVTRPDRRSGQCPSHLFDEFSTYYRAERCAWAPAEPARLYNLAFKELYPGCEGRLQPEEFLSVMYETLGFRGAERPGLFQTFEPGKYNGGKPLAEHFVNFFARKLRGKLAHALAKTGQKRPPRPERVPHIPELGLIRRTHAGSCGREIGEQLPACWRRLDARERKAVELSFWEGLSARRVGAALGVDHKTVPRVLSRALARLRRELGEPGAAHSSQSHSPKSGRSAE